MRNSTETSPAESTRARALRTELVRRIALFIGSADRLSTDIPGLLLSRRTAPTTSMCVTYEPSVVVVAQGRKRAELGRASFVFDERHYLLTSVDLPIVSQVMEASPERPFLCLMLKLEMPVVRELVALEEVHVPGPPADSPAMITGEVTVELLEACCRLLGLLEAPKDIPFLGTLLQREIIYRLLRGPEGGRLRGIATLGDQSHRTAKVIAWLKSNFAKPVRVEDLAGIAGMGLTAFHHHFRSLTAMSPLQYLKQLRLHAARTRMLIDGLDAASAAFEVGYESPSQFNREYSRFFGQPPMRDIRALRLVGDGPAARGDALGLG